MSDDEPIFAVDKDKPLYPVSDTQVGAFDIDGRVRLDADRFYNPRPLVTFSIDLTNLYELCGRSPKYVWIEGNGELPVVVVIDENKTPPKNAQEIKSRIIRVDLDSRVDAEEDRVTLEQNIPSLYVE